MKPRLYDIWPDFEPVYDENEYSWTTLRELGETLLLNCGECDGPSDMRHPRCDTCVKKRSGIANIHIVGLVKFNPQTDVARVHIHIRGLKPQPGQQPVKASGQGPTGASRTGTDRPLHVAFYFRQKIVIVMATFVIDDLGQCFKRDF